MNLIFDMDGVIVDNMAYHVLAWKKFCDNHSLNISTETIRAQFGKKNIEHFRLFFNDEINDEQSAIFAEEKESIYREIFLNELKPVPGLISFLEEIKSQKIKCAVATSAPTKNVEYVLDNLKIRNYFNVIVDETYVERGKPDPQIFLKAAEFLKVKPQNCIVFEDAFHGVDAALAAGMKVVALLTTYPKNLLQKANYIVQDFREVNLAMLEHIL